MRLKKRLVSGMATAAMLVGGLAFTGTPTHASVADGNQVSTWCEQGVKYDNLSGQTFTIPAPPTGYEWTKLILNGGNDGTQGGENERSYEYNGSLATGTVVTRPGAAVSNAILCTKKTPEDTTTTEPEVTTTTTATETTTATVPDETPEVTEVEGDGGTVPAPAEEETTTTEPPPAAAATTTPPVAGQGGTTPPTTPSLPQTGAGSTGIMQVAALLLLAGAAAFFAARRRTPEAA